MTLTWMYSIFLVTHLTYIVIFTFQIGKCLQMPQKTADEIQNGFTNGIMTISKFLTLQQF